MKTDWLTPITDYSEKWIREGTHCYPLLLGILILFGFTPLLYPGIPIGHDCGFHLSRLYSLSQGIANGVWPAWINDSAIGHFGYGTGFFYSDLYLYPSALLIACGLPIVTAYKLFLLIWGILTAYSMYYVAEQISGHRQFSAFAAALLYTWSSYFATDVFNRAALGEVMAFLFVPWILLGIWRVLYGEPQKFLPLALGFAGLFYAHSITFVLMSIATSLIFLFHFFLFLKEIRRFLWLIPAGLTAAALAAFAYVPMFEQLLHLEFNLTGKTMASPIAQHVVPITRLFLEFPYMKMEYWIPPGIGIIFLVVLLQRLRVHSKRSDVECFRDMALIAGSVFLLSATNALPWEGMMRVLSSIQFPWRCYLPATAFLALGGGLLLGNIVGSDRKRQQYWFFALLLGCGFAWSLNTAYVYAAKIHEKKFFNHFSQVDNQNFSASGQHYLMQGTTLAELQDAVHPVLLNGKAITSGSRSYTPYGVRTYTGTGARPQEADAPSVVELPVTPYHGYCAVDLESGKTLPLDFSKKKFQVLCPSGLKEFKIRIFYQNTLPQKAAFAISVLTLLVCAGIGIRTYQTSKKGSDR